MNTTYERLSSGLRINSAKDDAAGLQIANRLTSQINGLNQANRNSNDAIALAQTIEAGIDEIPNMLQRVRTLAVQAANGINTQEDRDALQNEATHLSEEITRIAEKTTYGGKTILFGGTNAASIYNTYNGSTKGAGVIQFQVGANSGDTIQLTVTNLSLSMLASKAGVNNDLVSGKTFNLSNATAASDTIVQLTRS